MSFNDKREVKEYLGFITKIENVCFERWRLTIVLTDASNKNSSNNNHNINNTNANIPPAYVSNGIAAAGVMPVPGLFDDNSNNDGAYRSAYDQVANTMTSIIEVCIVLCTVRTALYVIYMCM